jgi:D-glycero-alpha-D-manno-heptose-7-phosphate kinase
MIISRTPLRISFAGGSTDLPSFYRRFGGKVISTAIDKYIYVTVNKKFDDDIRVGYSVTEITDSVDKINHDLVREAMRKVGIHKQVEVTTIGDVPGKGTGLGSSSTLTVGLLNALYAHTNKMSSPEQLAKEACQIELDILKEPIGKQDQYIAAFGGLQYIRFNKDDSVHVDPIICSQETIKDFSDHLLLFHTGKGRSAGKILKTVNTDLSEKIETMLAMKDQVDQIKHCLLHDDIPEIGRIMHEGWELKKKTSSSVSNPEIDLLYAKARKAGATGGKITGAGGGGFLMLFCPPKKQDGLRKALGSLRELKFGFEPKGSTIIFVGK